MFHRTAHLSKLDDFSFFFCPSLTFLAQPFSQNTLSIKSKWISGWNIQWRTYSCVCCGFCLICVSPQCVWCLIEANWANAAVWLIGVFIRGSTQTPSQDIHPIMANHFPPIKIKGMLQVTFSPEWCQHFFTREFSNLFTFYPPVLPV